jgi:hypothetical protein
MIINKKKKNRTTKKQVFTKRFQFNAYACY